MGDHKLRAAYLRQVLPTLYPGSADPEPRPGSRSTAGPAEGTSEYLVVPSARAPRLLVPAQPRAAAVGAVRRYAEPRSRRARLQRAALIALLRSGGSWLALPDRVRVAVAGSVEAYLREILAEPLVMSIHIGPARANRKAVLQLLRPDGTTLGFAKLGTGTLTRRLVRAETAALTSLAGAGLQTLTIPEVRHAGHWDEHALLVQSALPVWLPRGALSAGRLAAAMREVALCQGTVSGPLATSQYWSALRARVAAVSGSADGAALQTAASALVARAGEFSLDYGAWHGDWTRWNMATLTHTLLVWDWERFASGVPVGFDALHYALHERVHTAPDPGEALTRVLRRVDELLSPFDIPGPAREVTALLYLIELAARYLADRQAEAGARLGALGTWLLPVLLRRLDVVP